MGVQTQNTSSFGVSTSLEIDWKNVAINSRLLVTGKMFSHFENTPHIWVCSDCEHPGQPWRDFVAGELEH